jgi:hypothetical protein
MKNKLQLPDLLAGCSFMKIVSLFIILITPVVANAQWNLSGSNLTTTYNVGIGGAPASKLDVGNFQNGQANTQVVLRLRNTIPQNQLSGWGSAIEFYNLSNNEPYDPVKNEGGAKLISEASEYGWSHNLKFRVIKNLSYAGQQGTDAITVDPEGAVNVAKTLWVERGVTASSDFADADPESSWASSLSVRNNTNTDNTFSRLTFVSQSGGFGTVSVRKTGQFTGDMYLQVRNGPGYYSTPLLLRSNGNVGVGGKPDRKLDAGYYKDGSVSNQVVLRLRNTIAGNNISGWGSAIEFYNMSNNMLDAGFAEGGAKIISEASDYGWAHNLKFRVVKNNGYQNQLGIDAMTINNDGNIGIGTTTPDTKLTVKGVIHTMELNIDVNGALGPVPDYVFEKQYDLKPINEVENYIATNKHLPEIPSAKEMEEKGMDVRAFNLLLLKKIEELTLYMIELKKENEQQTQQIQQLLNRKNIK